MKNELDYILHTYFSVPNIRIKYCGETSHLDGFKGIISNLVSFDHPDAYAIIENEVFIFEHFEFDGSDNQSRKGSQQHRLVESENRVFSDWTPSPELPIYRGTINANYTLENYRNNLIKSFNKHYNEIDAYIETLRTKRIIKGNERITTIFFIEDISLFGSYIISNNNDGSIKPLELPLCDFFSQ